MGLWPFPWPRGVHESFDWRGLALRGAGLINHTNRGKRLCATLHSVQGHRFLLERLNWKKHPIAFTPSDEPIERYNIAPIPNVATAAPGWKNGLRMSAVPWGYAPHWPAKARGACDQTQRLETARRPANYGRPSEGMPLTGLPADGCMKCVKDPGRSRKKKPPLLHQAENQTKPCSTPSIGHFHRGGGWRQATHRCFASRHYSKR